jgi:hypothetical protein
MPRRDDVPDSFRRQEALVLRFARHTSPGDAVGAVQAIAPDPEQAADADSDLDALAAEVERLRGEVSRGAVGLDTAVERALAVAPRVAVPRAALAEAIRGALVSSVPVEKALADAVKSQEGMPSFEEQQTIQMERWRRHQDEPLRYDRDGEPIRHGHGGAPGHGIPAEYDLTEREVGAVTRVMVAQALNWTEALARVRRGF